MRKSCEEIERERVCVCEREREIEERERERGVKDNNVNPNNTPPDSLRLG